MRQPPLNQDIFIIVQQNCPMKLAPTRAERKIWPLFYATTPTIFTSYDEAFNAVKRQRRREVQKALVYRGDHRIIRVPKDE